MKIILKVDAGMVERAARLALQYHEMIRNDPERPPGWRDGALFCKPGEPDLYCYHTAAGTILVTKTGGA